MEALYERRIKRGKVGRNRRPGEKPFFCSPSIQVIFSVFFSQWETSCGHSPVTGYRRIGTRVSEIRALFETGITVRSICEPLRACFANANATEMAKLLHDRGFDVAGVKDDDTETIKRFVRGL